MNNPQYSDDDFASVLKNWRKQRRLSQLELSSISDTSSRHISFLERGRAKPSREMVLKLGAAMDIPPGDVNAGLTLAGFAPAYPKAQLNDKSVQILKTVMQTMLDNHSPWPAVACEHSWNILSKNTAATHLLELAGLNTHTNLMQAMLKADDAFVNWAEVAQLMLRRLDAEQLQRPNDTELQAIRRELANHPKLGSATLQESCELDVVVPVKIRANGTMLSLVSMVAQFGAVQEITYAGVHVELFFPVDEVSKRYFSQLNLA